MKANLLAEIKKATTDVVKICDDAFTISGAEKKVEVVLTALAQKIIDDKEGK